MFAAFRQDWKQFKHEEPGRRFQTFYDARQRRRGGKWSAGRLLALAAGIALMLAGPVVGLVPGPGGLVVFALGLALIATEFRPAARLVDWLEPKLRSGWAKAKQRWIQLSAAAKIALSLLCIAVLSVLGYFVYSLIR